MKNNKQFIMLIAALIFLTALSLFALNTTGVLKIFSPGRTISVEKKTEVIEDIKKPVVNPAPDFALLDINGEKKSMSDFSGKVIILNFWATWCPPCREEIKHLIELYEEYKHRGLEIIGVSLDWNAQRVAGPFAEEKGINYTILLGDQNVVDLYGGIMSIPTTFIIGRDGGIRDKYIGYRNKTDFEKDIEGLL